MTLIEFLLARVAEDEARARAAVIPAHEAPNAYMPHPELSRWRYSDDGEVEFDYDSDHQYASPLRVTQDGEGLQSSVCNDAYGHHIANWDPARVLAECEAKRRIIDDIVTQGYLDDVAATDGLAFRVLYDLCAPYSDHPDCHPDWKP